jgi:hypothetical protein
MPDVASFSLVALTPQSCGATWRRRTFSALLLLLLLLLLFLLLLLLLLHMALNLPELLLLYL